MRRRLILLTVFSFALSTGVARSTTVIPPTFDQLVAESATVFVGEVTNTRAVMDVSRDGRSIHTLVTFRVEDVWKGSVGAVTQLQFLGGTVGDETMLVNGMPQFTVGQRSVLFVSGEARSASPLVGFMYGRFFVERNLGIDRVFTHDRKSLGSIGDIGANRPPAFESITAMRLSELASAVQSRARIGRAR